MWKAILAALLILLASKAARGQPAPATGSISGQVINVATGLPVAGAIVKGESDKWYGHAITDPAGHYLLQGLPPGTATVIAHLTANEEDGLAYATRTATLRAGEDLKSLDLRIRPQGKISGKVVNRNNQPLSGMQVFLIAREYAWGALRYFYADSANTDDAGQYHLVHAEPGRAYLLMVNKHSEFDTVSTAPADPAQRQQITATTFYPGVTAIDTASPITLRPGESREGMDVMMGNAPSFCIDGKALTGKYTGSLDIQLHMPVPAVGKFGGQSEVGDFLDGDWGKINSGATFRICDIPPGTWRISAAGGATLNQSFHGSELVSIASADLHNLTIPSHEPFLLEGDVVWDGAPPDKPVRTIIAISLAQFTYGQEMDSTLPGEFRIRYAMPEYGATVTGLPQGMYVKDILYGDRSVLGQPLGESDPSAKNRLRVIVARDGSFIQAKSSAGAWLTVIPATADTESAIAFSHVSGQADQSGMWKSPALAPGKYYVLASDAPAYMTPETIAKIMLKRLVADPVELGATSTVTAIAKDLE